MTGSGLEAPATPVDGDKRRGGWADPATTALGAIIAAVVLAFAYDLELLRILEIPQEQALPVVLGAAFAIIFLRVPASGRGTRAHPPWYDVILAAAGFGICMYFAYRYSDLIENFYTNRDEAFAVGIVIIPMIVEGLRRTAGWSLVAVVCGFFLYALMGHLVPGDLQGQEKKFFPLVAYLAADNVALFGLAMKIVTYVVVLFVFMGQLLLKTGASGWFTEFAAALLGRSRGGSAKIAIVASGLFGSISGSAVSNVASTGVITIPLMRQGGYDAKTAGAFEAVASTGGQIMPPVMGAAAFLMAEFLDISYTEVVVAAVIPAFLYYLAVFLQADLEAARRGIAPVPEDLIPPILRVIREGWIFVLPYIVLVAALFIQNDPPAEAALKASLTLPVVVILFGFKDKRTTLWGVAAAAFRDASTVPRISADLARATWITFKDVLKSAAEAGRSSADIIMIGAMAGLIIGIIETTGLGYALTIVLLKVGEDSLLVLLLLTAAISIVLGMGMPTASIYVLLAIMVAPTLIKLGIDPLAAHLFVLYFGLMSMITPPVAIAAFTAAKLAGANPMATAITSCRLGWVAYIIPFVFVFSPALLMKGGVVEIVASVVAAAVGTWIASAGLIGYLFQRLPPMMRLLFVIAGLALLVPVDLIDHGYAVRIAGAALAVALFGREFLVRSRRGPPVRATGRVDGGADVGRGAKVG